MLRSYQNGTAAHAGTWSGGKAQSKIIDGLHYRDRRWLSIDPRDAASKLGGEPSGRNVYCPGPGHSKSDRSLSILFDPNAPEGFTCYSHASDDPIECRDYIKAKLGFHGGTIPPAIRATHKPAAPGDIDHTAIALRLWNEARSLAGTPAETYLKRRGVWHVLPDGADGEALRWHRSGFMVALVRSILTDAPQAIHRTYIDADGNKTDRKCLGHVGGGAVKLTANADVGYALGVGEGIETTLSLRRLPDLENIGVWSLLSAGGVERFPVLRGIESLWLAVDADPTGQHAADTVASRWTNAGNEIITVKSTTAGADINDVREVA